jgi:hypothetical protein
LFLEGLNISKIFGYGEDAFTFWALRHRKSEILKQFNDKTPPSDCLVFYRPSFGRRGGGKSSEFGEFDAILVSLENIYLIESKWNNLSAFKEGKIVIKPEQKLRHHIFSWYVTHWDGKYEYDWKSFFEEQRNHFQKEFGKYKKTIPHNDTVLARNLQFVLSKLRKHCVKFSSPQNIKNILLFFYNKNKSTTPVLNTEEFDLISIDYSKEIEGNFIELK